jgi:hypothetical protein
MQNAEFRGAVGCYIVFAAGCWLLLAHFFLLGCCWLFLGSPICTKTADQDLRSGGESSFSLNRKLNPKTGALTTD